MHISLDKAGKERARSSATSTAFVADRDRRSLEDKRLAGQPKGHFVHKNGQRHHSFDNEKAPYPISYNRDMLETCVIRMLLRTTENFVARHSTMSLSVF